MSLFKNVKQVLGIESVEAEKKKEIEEMEIEDVKNEEKEQVVEETENFTVPIYSGTTTQKDVYESSENMSDYQTIFVNPTNFEECKKIANYINEDKIVTVNLEGLNTESAQRLLDFLSGAMEVKKARFITVSKKVYVSVPDGINSYIEDEK